MRLQTAEAIILHVMDLHDRDRIVAFLTPAAGQKRGVARGSRRKHSRFAGQLQPLAKARVTWFEKERSELVRINEVDLTRSHHRIQRDLDGILLAAYLSDHMLHFAQENEDSRLLYRLLDSTLEALEEGVDPTLAARYFEAWVLRLSGIFPPPTACPECGRELAKQAVLPARGEALLCTDCARRQSGGRMVGEQALRFLRRISTETLPAIARRPPRREVLQQAEGVAAHVRRSFLGYELKSYRVMRETLRGLGQ